MKTLFPSDERFQNSSFRKDIIIRIFDNGLFQSSELENTKCYETSEGNYLYVGDYFAWFVFKLRTVYSPIASFSNIS